MYPLDTVKTRIQAAQDGDSRELPAAGQHKTEQSRFKMLHLLLRIIKREGVLALFKGFAANMINTFSMRTCPYR